jgi:hypothetical protein
MYTRYVIDLWEVHSLQFLVLNILVRAWVRVLATFTDLLKD